MGVEARGRGTVGKDADDLAEVNQASEGKPAFEVAVDRPLERLVDQIHGRDVAGAALAALFDGLVALGAGHFGSFGSMVFVADANHSWIRFASEEESVDARVQVGGDVDGHEITTTSIPAARALETASAVPVPPGNATTKSGLLSTIAWLRIGPARRP